MRWRTQKPLKMNSIEQSDAEEALAEWMEAAQDRKRVEAGADAGGIGIDAEELGVRARASFRESLLPDALSWLEALVSSMQLVATIEESIGRVSDLVHAVKSYAYEGKGQKQSIDVNESIHATLVILGHKLREKADRAREGLGPGSARCMSECTGLNQIWTNLLDNAIDAVPHGGHIRIRRGRKQTPAEAAKSGRQARISASRSATTAAAFRSSASRTSSTRSTRPRLWAWARGWVWVSSTGSWSSMGGRSRSRRFRGTRSSGCVCRGSETKGWRGR